MRDCPQCNAFVDGLTCPRCGFAERADGGERCAEPGCRKPGRYRVARDAPKTCADHYRAPATRSGERWEGKGPPGGFETLYAVLKRSRLPLRGVTVPEHDLLQNALRRSTRQLAGPFASVPERAELQREPGCDDE